MPSNVLLHHCPAMPISGIRISREPDLLPNEDWRWALCVERTASEEDLEQNAYLEEVGGRLWSLAVGIRHCPYCGTLLPGEQDAVLNGSAGFRLMDHGEWTVRVSEST